jgi:hypothetical protein
VQLQFLGLLAGQFPIRRRHNPFLRNFAFHNYVLPASKKFHKTELLAFSSWLSAPQLLLSSSSTELIRLHLREELAAKS